MVEHLMVQQQVENVWQHMVGVICLNLTNRKVVKPFLTDLFAICSTPEKFLRSLACTFPVGIIGDRAERHRRFVTDRE